MTKREEFTKAAMIGILAAGTGVRVEMGDGSQVTSMVPEHIADAACGYADACINALNKEAKP